MAPPVWKLEDCGTVQGLILHDFPLPEEIQTMFRGAFCLHRLDKFLVRQAPDKFPQLIVIKIFKILMSKIPGAYGKTVSSSVLLTRHVFNAIYLLKIDDGGTHEKRC